MQNFSKKILSEAHIANYLFLLDTYDWSQDEGGENFSDKRDDSDEIKKV